MVLFIVENEVLNKEKDTISALIAKIVLITKIKFENYIPLIQKLIIQKLKLLMPIQALNELFLLTCELTSYGFYRFDYFFNIGLSQG